MRLADLLGIGILVIGILGIIFIVWNYSKGLKKSPRDIWFLFLYKIVEYTAYASMNMAIILWLTRDVGLGDMTSREYIMAWSVMLSVMAMIAGALVDTIGVKRTIQISIVFLLISRFFMSFVTNPVLIFILGFIPLAIGFAIVGPVVSVGIKRYTTKEGATLGFALFYVLMNLAYAIGGWYFDFLRDRFALIKNGKIINENLGTTILGHHFSTYQLFFVSGFFFTIISFFISSFIRRGVFVNENDEIEIKEFKKSKTPLDALKKAGVDTFVQIKSVFVEKYFWIFILMLSTTLFVRFIFYHFHYTFPTYGIRVLGEGAKIGQVYGLLNPVLIIFFVPLIASFTKKISSYKMLIVGSIVSSLSCFIAVIPGKYFAHLTDSLLGELVFVKWLGLAKSSEALASMVSNHHITAYWPLMFFIFVFTIGESIWSPRLMQFTAEIAPKGKEGTYIALSVLPFLAAKFFVAPMSGELIKTYVPLDSAKKVMEFYPNHQMVWFWIGITALITPISLILLKSFFFKRIGGNHTSV